MTWASIILLILQLAYELFRWRRDAGLIKQGEDQEIARQTAIILGQTEAAKKLREQVNALNEDEIDKKLRELEPTSSR